MMKTISNKWQQRRRQRQQSGRPVLVTFYVIQPRKVYRSGRSGRATSSHTINRHDHHRQHHHNSHRGHHDKGRGGNGGKFPDNRRADLLEYSRQLRALARQATTAAAASTPPRPPLARLQRHHIDTAVAVHGDEGHPAAVNRWRLERAMSQQQIRQRCFGRDGWSWKRVLVLIFPTRSNRDGVVGRIKPRRPKRMDGDDSEKNRDNNQKGWPAALLGGKLTVTKSRRDHGGFAKKLMSVFRKRSR